MTITTAVLPPTRPPLPVSEMSPGARLRQERMNHVMVDLETLSTRVDGVVLSIGAVTFSPWGTGYGRPFHESISASDSTRRGMRVDSSTFAWWLEQGATARQAIADKMSGDLPHSIATAVTRFATWLPVNPVIWGFGSDVDVARLQGLFERCETKTPWHYRDVRCLRTLGALIDPMQVLRPSPQVAHDALADAKAQAEWCQAMIRVLKGRDL